MGTGVSLRLKRLLGLREEEGWDWMQWGRAVWASCVGGQGGAGWSNICYGEDRR